MNHDALVADLLSVWMRQRAQGQPVGIEQLCSERPELLPHLQRCVQALQQVEAALSGSPPPTAAEQATLPPASAGAQAQTLPPPPAPQTLSTLAPEDPHATLPFSSSNGAAGPARPLLSGYAIERELGRGGMGVVYQAKDLRLKRCVALKMILASGHAGQSDLARFKTEAEAVARLQHPGIVQIHEVGERDGLPYFCMEYCPGGSLDRKLNGTPLPPLEAAALVEKLAVAMQAAHEKGVIHRDLKPANVLLAEDGTPKITDFGLAKKLDEAGQTHTGAVLGTPSYMAPEQAGGQKDVGPAADVYALGSILYELLTGRPPFRGATLADTFFQVINAEPVAVRRLQPKTPLDLETVCLKCLQKNPAKRYPNAQGLADDLARWRQGKPVKARRVGMAGRAMRWARREPGLALTAAVALLALVTVAVVASLSAKQQADLRRAADQSSRQLQQEAAQKQKALEALELADGKTKDALRELRQAKTQIEQSLTRLQAETLAKTTANLRLQEANATIRRSLEDLQREARAKEQANQVIQKTLAELRQETIARKKAHQETRTALEKLLQEKRAREQQQQMTQYARELRNAQSLWKSGDRAAARAILLTQPLDLRGWEWKYLARLCEQSQGGHGSGIARDNPAEARTLQGHAQRVEGVAFRLDGRQVASVGADRTIRLWDAGSGKEVRAISGHTDVIRSLAYSPDGKLLATGSLDQSLRVWDVRTGALVHTMTQQGLQFFSVAFSPNGKLLVGCGGRRNSDSDPWTGEAVVWDTASGDRRHVLRGHTDLIRCADFSPNGRLLVTGSYDRTLKLWEVSSGKEIKSLKGHAIPIISVAFSPGGEKLASTSGGFDRDGSEHVGGLKIWDVATGAELVSLRGHQKTATAVAFSPDGERLVTGSVDGTLKVWDVATGQELLTVTGHTRGVLSLAFDTEGSRIASGSEDATVKIWETGAPRPLWRQAESHPPMGRFPK